MPPRPPSAPGTARPPTVGRFELFGTLGTTRAGTVYRARDGSTGAEAVVTLLAAAVTTDRGRFGRLVAAVRESAALEHPNLLRVLDAGTDGGTGYLAGEWLDGGSLGQMIDAHRRLPEETAVRIVTQVGQALHHTRAGALGWPVDPDHILVRPDGMAKLSFIELPRSGGPPTDVPDPDPCPVRALGATLYAAVTGAPPDLEPPPPPARGRRGRNERSSSGRRLVFGLGEAVNQAVQRAIHHDPAKRPATVLEFLTLLRTKPRTPGPRTAEPRSAAPEPGDRRASVRYAVGAGGSCTVHASVFDPPGSIPVGDGEVWPAVVRNVSAGGVGLLLARRFEPGTDLIVEMAGGPGRAGRTFPARVVRAGRNGLGHWLHGCSFLTPLTERELAQVLDCADPAPTPSGAFKAPAGLSGGVSPGRRTPS
jgi:hypothetical protein